MHRKSIFSIVVSLALASLSTAPASASVVLIAQGGVAGTATDLSGLTAPLENGAPGNLLGGLGSGIAYAGGNLFLATPDRGPNAVSYNAGVDNTTSYIDRFQTFNLALTANTPGSVLPYSLNPVLQQTTLLSSATPLFYGSGADFGLGSGVPSLNATNDTYYFTGRSDNFDPSLNSTASSDARFDPEGVRVSNDGKSIFVSDEYGPYVYQFDRATGERIKTFTLPANLAVATPKAQETAEIAANSSGRVTNKGMEGLAITPDGKTLVGIMQAPLIQDGGNIVRIVSIDIASGATHEYAYKLTDGSGVSDIVAINDHEFLVDERDGKGLGDGSNAKVKKIYRIDLSGATDVTSMSGTAALTPLVVTKNAVPFLDIVSALTALGVKASDIPAKIEGMAFGDDVVVNGLLQHTLYISSDNDFTTSLASSFYVFAFSDSDLPGFQAQQITSVAEPGSMSIVLAGLGLLGLVRKRNKAAGQ